MKKFNEEFKEYKQSLIDLIVWYRDEYHKSEFCHNDLIEDVEKATNQSELDIIEKIIDGWLD